MEYAPYQRVPKPRSKKDVREGTIMKGMVEESFISMWEFVGSHGYQCEQYAIDPLAA